MAAIRTLLFVFLTALLSLLVAASAVTNVTMATIAAANVTLTTTEEVAVTIQDLTADDHLEEVSVAVLATTEEQQEPPATVPRPGPLLLSLQKRHAYSRGNDIKKNVSYINFLIRAVSFLCLCSVIFLLRKAGET